MSRNQQVLIASSLVTGIYFFRSEVSLVINPSCWFQIFFMSSLFGEVIHFDEHIFQMGGSTTN